MRRLGLDARPNQGVTLSDNLIWYSVSVLGLNPHLRSRLFCDGAGPRTAALTAMGVPFVFGGAHAFPIQHSPLVLSSLPHHAYSPPCQRYRLGWPGSVRPTYSDAPCSLAHQLP